MSAVRHQASFNGITFNQVYGGTDPDDPSSLVAAYQESDYRLEYFDDSPVQVRDYSEPRQMQEGSEPNEAIESLRIIRGGGRILGSSYADLEDKVWAMKAAFALSEVRRLSAFGVVDQFPDEPVGVLPFYFKRDTAGGVKELCYYVRPQQGRPALHVEAKGGLVRPFNFSLAAFDPRCYDGDGWSVPNALNSSNGWTDVTMDNPSTVVMYPQIKFNMNGAGGDTVTLTNETTGESFTMDLSSQTADFWIIPERGEILRASDRANRYYLKKWAGKFLTNLYFAPGDNDWSINDSTGITSVVFYILPAYA